MGSAECTLNLSDVNHEETSLATCRHVHFGRSLEEKFIKILSQRVDGRPRFFSGLPAILDSQFVQGFPKRI